ncbi:MAG: hypothetical protein M1834_001834 [Cirrosporium novae-zelandiae]|nr:MAG: hypothetical protein M1834_001834 [Cirrosporium novae-zelandiae]
MAGARITDRNCNRYRVLDEKAGKHVVKWQEQVEVLVILFHYYQANNGHGQDFPGTPADDDARRQAITLCIDTE